MLRDISQPTQQPPSEPLYEFSIYPFSADPVFQEGLQSIVSSTRGKSPEELQNIIGQAKAFYFARTTGHKVTWENYLKWQRSHPFPLLDAETAGTAAIQLEERKNLTQLTFQQITDLINTEQTHLIPNNKVIPEALHSDAPSESTNRARKKPWE